MSSACPCPNDAVGVFGLDVAELAGSEPAKWLARDRRDRFEVSIAMDDDLFGDDGGTCDQYVDES